MTDHGTTQERRLHQRSSMHKCHIQSSDYPHSTSEVQARAGTSQQRTKPFFWPSARLCVRPVVVVITCLRDIRAVPSRDNFFIFVSLHRRELQSAVSSFVSVFWLRTPLFTVLVHLWCVVPSHITRVSRSRCALTQAHRCTRNVGCACVAGGAVAVFLFISWSGDLSSATCDTATRAELHVPALPCAWGHTTTRLAASGRLAHLFSV